MTPPFISYITFNRLGLTMKNLPAILNGSEDFEMHIIDCNSRDGTWDYITSLNDSRIKTKLHFDLNHGKTYALNLQLVRRRPEQYFFSIGSETFIETENWISKFMATFEAFPEAGLLGVQADDDYLPELIPRHKDQLSYLELSGNTSDAERSYVPGHCLCLKPDLIKEIGYFSEENYCEEMDLSYRVCNYTSFKAGFVTNVHIQLPQSVPCDQCAYFEKCRLNKASKTCFTEYDKYSKSTVFLRENKWRFDETIRDMKTGARPVYCASLLDDASTKSHVYNRDWAMSNITYFIQNTN